MDENKNNYVSSWLLLITFLISLIICVGGLTRLTDSGLSITRWDVILGIIPPLTENDWEEVFSLYKKIPEYKLLNFSMGLEEFKTIFWWEYIHRLLGRIIGLFYIIPLIYFSIKKKINKKKLLFLYFIFFLILLQGFIGWYMVKSGLTEGTDVSHYRLSIHLGLAFIILIFTFWNFLDFTSEKNIVKQKKLPIYLPSIFLFIVFLQISIGALVSGLDAGQIYQTWPLMNGSFFPNDSFYKDLLSKDFFENPSIVQFIHRNIAYFIVIFYLIIATIVFKNPNFAYLRKTTIILFIFLLFQVFLGILTVLSGAEIILASMHQIGSIFLVIASVNLMFKNQNN